MYYEDAKENAAFERCTDVIINMIMKYGPVLKRKWAVDEWLRNIHVECFGTKNEWRSFMAEDKKKEIAVAVINVTEECLKYRLTLGCINDIAVTNIGVAHI